MRRSFLSLSILTIAFLTPGLKANAQQSPVPLSLQDCTDYALKHNYNVKNAMLDVQIQHAQINELLAAAYPHISGKAELDDFLNPQKTFIDANQFAGKPGHDIQPLAFTLPYAGSASISASQLLFDGSVWVAVEARSAVMELARQTAEVTKENIRYNVFRAYHGLVIAYHQYDIVKNSLSYARLLERDLEITQQNGLAEKIEVERTNVQVNNLASDSIRIGNMLTVSEQVLKYQMGMDINTPIVLTDTNVDARKLEINTLLNQESDYTRVPEFRLAQSALQTQQYNVKRYKLAAIPSLSLFGNLGYNYADYDLSPMFKFNNYLFNSLVGIQLNIPIFNGLQRVNQLREAKLNVDKSLNNIENAKLTIDFQTAQSRTTLRNSILQVQSQHRNLDLANDVLDLAQKKYKAGVGSNQEVTQAQTDQLRAETNYFSALIDMINAEADLKKALGLLK